jgi:TonB-dependent starch-binding outer membrane protein SusC
MYRKSGTLILLLAVLGFTEPLTGQDRNVALARSAAPGENGASLLDRTAGLDVKGVTLSSALTRLSYTTGIALAFSPSLLPSNLLVDCACRAATIRHALDRILDGTGLRYTIVGDQVVVERPRPEAPSIPTMPIDRAVPILALETAPVEHALLTEVALTGMVVGRITDAQTFEPLAGTQVAITALGIGTLTSSAGRFTLTGVPAGTHTVSVLRIGYRAVEETVQVVAGGTAQVDISLRPEALQLDALVVTGTGREVRTREMGTAIGQVRRADFQNAPVRNPEEILMGRQPGVTVQLRSGQPGAMGHITLRGATSISATRNQPLIYVDGVRLYSHGISGAQNARQGVHALQSVAAADIERIEIVRGAAAATLYGSEAAAGVIQVFTKQGAAGAPVWEVSVGTGINTLGRVGAKSDPTNLYLRCGEPTTALARGSWTPITMFDPTCPESGSWVEPGTTWNMDASVRGGSQDFRYYVSARRSHEEGVVKPGFAENTGVRGNFEFGVTDKLTMSFNSAYSTGTIRWMPDGDRGSGFFNNLMGAATSSFQDPAVCADLGVSVDHCVVHGRLLSHQVSHQWTDHFTLGGTARWEPSTNLQHRLTLGYDYIESLGQEIILFGFHRPERRLGRLINDDHNRITLTADYVGSWTRDGLFGRDIGSAFSWGVQLVETKSQDYGSQADDFAGPGLVTMADAASARVSTDDQMRVVNPGIFLQEALSFNDRLFVTLGARLDGHSAFGREFGFQMYPKLGASYVISDHDFWPEHLVQTFRLRGALGEAGQAPGAFDATRMWATLPGPGGQAGFTPAVLGNPDLGPERTREFELGFEGTTLQDRFSLDVTVYRQDTYDALVGVQPIPSQGFLSRQLENIGHIRNQGYEVQATADLVQRRNVLWSARAHISRNDSEAIDLGGEIALSSLLQQIREGAPVPAFFGPRMLNPDEFAAPVYSEEHEYLGSPWPVRTIGLGTSLTLGQRLTLDAQGEFQGGHLMFNSSGYAISWNGAWQPCFDTQMALASNNQAALSNVTARERARCAVTSGTRDQYSWLEPADFFKLRVASLTYEVPSRFLRGVDRASVTLSGRNLLTVTDYTGLSVEANVGSGPNVMTRRDHLQIPPYRTFQLAVRTTF